MFNIEHRVAVTASLSLEGTRLMLSIQIFWPDDSPSQVDCGMQVQDVDNILKKPAFAGV